METLFIIVSIVLAVAILYFSSRAKKRKHNCACGNGGCCTGSCQRCDCENECDEK